MGHLIEYLTFDIETEHEKIVNKLNAYCERESDYHGGLYYGVKFKDNLIFESFEEAEEWLDKNAGEYENIAVRYKTYNIKESAKLKKLKEKEKYLWNKKTALDEKQYYSKDTVKSKTIGCKNCESKIAIAYLKRNYCPVCMQDLRPASFLNKLEKLTSDIKDINKQIKDETKRIKNKSKYKEKYLVRFEFHC